MYFRGEVRWCGSLMTAECEDSKPKIDTIFDRKPLRLLRGVIAEYRLESKMTRADVFKTDCNRCI